LDDLALINTAINGIRIRKISKKYFMIFCNLFSDLPCPGISCPKNKVDSVKFIFEIKPINKMQKVTTSRVIRFSFIIKTQEDLSLKIIDFFYFV